METGREQPRDDVPSDAGDPAVAELDRARAARLAEMRSLTMSERLSRFQRLCVEASRVGRAQRP